MRGTPNKPWSSVPLAGGPWEVGAATGQDNATHSSPAELYPAPSSSTWECSAPILRTSPVSTYATRRKLLLLSHPTLLFNPFLAPFQPISLFSLICFLVPACSLGVAVLTLSMGFPTEPKTGRVSREFPLNIWSRWRQPLPTLSCNVAGDRSSGR